MRCALTDRLARVCVLPLDTPPHADGTCVWRELAAVRATCVNRGLTPRQEQGRRGVYRGRRKALPATQAQELRRRANAGEVKAALAREFGISRETLYQYLRARS